MYATAIPLAFASPIASEAIYVALALVWLIPDRRIESHVRESAAAAGPHRPQS
jgi:hypothetical protein